MMPNCLISVELYTSYYAQMWRPCTGTNKSNNISMLNLPVIKIIKKKIVYIHKTMMSDLQNLASQLQIKFRTTRMPGIKYFVSI